MAKKIFASQNDIESFICKAEEMMREKLESLGNKRLQSDTDRKVNFSIKITDEDDREASLLFTPKAWCKMYTLVNYYQSEVEWHGIVKRIQENVFEISDILTFPHEVTATTVTSNHEEYSKWLDELDDETFNSLRFHGHSHVNMDVTPSALDMSYRKDMLNNFDVGAEDEDNFYIFLITNKKLNISAEIYDLKNNALYSTADKNIDIDVIFDDNDWISLFMDKAREQIKKRVVETPKQHNSYTGYQYNKEKQLAESSYSVDKLFEEY